MVLIALASTTVESRADSVDELFTGVIACARAVESGCMEYRFELGSSGPNADAPASFL